RVSVAALVAAPEISPVTQPMPAQVGPRIHHLGEFRIQDDGTGRAFEVGTVHGRKFYVGPAPTIDAAEYERVEAIPEGARLQGTIRILNLNDAEMGGLHVALGVTPESCIKLGGGKGHGFGRVRVRRVVHALLDDRRRPRAAEPELWSCAFEASPDRWDSGA